MSEVGRIRSEPKDANAHGGTGSITSSQRTGGPS